MYHAQQDTPVSYFWDANHPVFVPLMGGNQRAAVRTSVQALGAEAAPIHLRMCSWPQHLALSQQTCEGDSGLASAWEQDFTSLIASTFCSPKCAWV